jgi:hypothetical protein
VQREKEHLPLFAVDRFRGGEIDDQSPQWAAANMAESEVFRAIPNDISSDVVELLFD